MSDRFKKIFIILKEKKKYTFHNKWKNCYVEKKIRVIKKKYICKVSNIRKNQNYDIIIYGTVKKIRIQCNKIVMDIR